jgi:hypothetical protein
VAFCRARLINLDFNQSFNEETQRGVERFPAITLVKKLGQIHREAHHDVWGLCMTFNSTMEWSEDAISESLALINDNIRGSEEFGEMLEQIFGAEVVSEIVARRQLIPDSKDFQQRFITVFVPKKIVESVFDQHWSIEIQASYRYLGPAGAPMTSWVMEFRSIDNTTESKMNVYQRNVSNLLRNSYKITEDGDKVLDFAI